MGALSHPQSGDTKRSCFLGGGSWPFSRTILPCASVKCVTSWFFFFPMKEDFLLIWQIYLLITMFHSRFLEGRKVVFLLAPDWTIYRISALASSQTYSPLTSKGATTLAYRRGRSHKPPSQDLTAPKPFLMCMTGILWSTPSTSQKLPWDLGVSRCGKAS